MRSAVNRRVPGRRVRRLSVLVAALAFVATTATLAAGPPASAVGNNCDAAPGTNSAFIASVAAAEQPAWRAFEAAIRSTGALYLCNDFATPPTTLPSTGAGSVVRVRPVYPSPTTSDSFAMRVMYLTATRTGTIVPATTLVIVPRTHVGTAPRSTYVWAHGTVGINATCREALDLATMVGAQGLLDRYVQRDMVVVAPDYLGIGLGGRVHPYLTRETTARTIIDAMRATKNLSAVTLAGTEWVVGGHSQGGLAAMATAEIAGTYGTSTGLHLRGAVALAGGGQLLPTLQGVMASSDLGNRSFVAEALYGFQADYPSVTPSTYLTAHADYAARTYLRDGAPYLNPFNLFEASLDNAGDPQQVGFVWGQGFVTTHNPGPDLGAALLPGNTPEAVLTDYGTPYASILDAVYQSNGYGPYGAFSIPSAEKDVRSCGYTLPHAVFGRLPGNDFLKLPIASWDASVLSVIAQNSIGTVSTSVPIDFVTGDLDPLNPVGTVTNPAPGTARYAFSKLCAAGDNAVFDLYPGSDHSTVVNASAANAEQWVVARLAGTPQVSGC